MSCRCENPRRELPTSTGLQIFDTQEPGGSVLVVYDTRALERAEHPDEAVHVMYGMIGMVPNRRCRGAMEITAAAARRGYGPNLYDIAMSVAQQWNAPGVIPDRKSVSEHAERVWRKMYDDRVDVESVPVGLLCPTWGREVLDRIYTIDTPYDVDPLLRTAERMDSERRNLLERMIIPFWGCVFYGKCPPGTPADAVRAQVANPRRRNELKRRLLHP